HGRLLGLVTRADLPEFAVREELNWLIVADVMRGQLPVVAFPDEPVRDAADRMLTAGLGELPVVAPEAPDRVVGLLTRDNVLEALARRADEEHRRDRPLPLPGRRAA